MLEQGSGVTSSRSGRGPGRPLCPRGGCTAQGAGSTEARETQTVGPAGGRGSREAGPVTTPVSFQERLAKSHGTQCGFCTPGMVMSMYALLRNHPQPSEEQLLAALGGRFARGQVGVCLGLLLPTMPPPAPLRDSPRLFLT